MNTHIHAKTLIAIAAASHLLGACSTAMTKPDGAGNVRSKLTQLQSDPELASRAPVAIKEAELAVIAAEEPREDVEQAQHLVLMADRKVKVDIARAQAQARLTEDQRKTLSEQRERAKPDSRTREADAARSDADIARGQAEAARMDTDAAKKQAADLQSQIAELNAKATDRGLVVTLGDVLFATGRSELKGGATSDLGRLATSLTQYPDRTVIIEGHTDSVGSADCNLGLSQRRADSVKSFLMGQGVTGTRITASGMGQDLRLPATSPPRGASRTAASK